MNTKTAKKLRRFAKIKGIEVKKVKKSFKKLGRLEQKIVVKEVFK